MGREKWGVVLANMGGAAFLPQLRQFLYNMFKDPRIVDSPLRHLLAPLLARFRAPKVWKNYEKVGGSRIYSITDSLCRKLSRLGGVEVVMGMRYTDPSIQSQLRRFERVILLPLYPHYSVTTTESVLDAVKMAVEKGYRGAVGVVQPFYNNLRFNRLIADSILAQMEGEEGEWHLIFSAHGLPVRLVEKYRDPYPVQIEEQVAILKGLVGERFKSVELAYQSRFGPGEWLRPYLGEVLARFKGERVAIYPISFLIDNSETDLELGVEYREEARKLGLKGYKLLSPPNDSDLFVEFYWELISELKGKLW